MHQYYPKYIMVEQEELEVPNGDHIEFVDILHDLDLDNPKFSPKQRCKKFYKGDRILVYKLDAVYGPDEDKPKWKKI